MIVWIKKEATKLPNDQRFKIINYDPDVKLLKVQSCGIPEDFYLVQLFDICGFELIHDRKLQVMLHVKVTGATTGSQ